jgi:cytochrome c553
MKKFAALTLSALVASTLMASDGAALYKKCAGCHGAKGEKKALGKSAPIAGWDKAKVVEALKGYKAGTRNVYGMGALMKGQVAGLSDADIEALADYISKLK